MLTLPNFQRSKGVVDKVNLPNTYTFSKNLILSLPGRSNHIWPFLNLKSIVFSWMWLFYFAFYFKCMLNLQFKVCNDDFLSACLHETQSELNPVWAYALGWRFPSVLGNFSNCSGISCAESLKLITSAHACCYCYWKNNQYCNIILCPCPVASCCGLESLYYHVNRTVFESGLRS